MGDRPALRRCTHLDPADFAASVWGQRASLSRRDQLAGGFTDLLDADQVDRLVSRQGLRTPFLRVARDGQTYPASRFTRGGGAGAAIGDQVDDAALARLFADGATLVLQGLHRTHEPILAFVQQLTADLGHPVQANAYVTPPRSRGFGAHYDVHDVFVLQAAGEKRWVIHPPVLVHPGPDQPWAGRREQVVVAARAEPLLDVVLLPGDALYLPAGFLHAAEALGETSVHLTLGVHPWTRAQLVQELIAELDEVPESRAPLPLGVDVVDLQTVTGLVAETVEWLRAALAGLCTDPAAVERVAGALGRRAGTASRAAPVGPLAQARALAAVELRTTLRWRPHLRVRVREVGTGTWGRLELLTPETTVTVPIEARDGIRRLVAGEPVSVLELVDGHDGSIEDSERLEIARTLLRSALVTAG